MAYYAISDWHFSSGDCLDISLSIRSVKCGDNNIRLIKEILKRRGGFYRQPILYIILKIVKAK